MQIGKEGCEKGGKTVDEASLGGGEVLQSPKFQGIGQIDAEEREKSDGENLNPVKLKRRAFEDSQKNQKQDARYGHPRSSQKKGRAVLHGHLAK